MLPPSYPSVLSSIVTSSERPFFVPFYSNTPTPFWGSIYHFWKLLYSLVYLSLLLEYKPHEVRDLVCLTHALPIVLQYLICFFR